MYLYDARCGALGIKVTEEGDVVYYEDRNHNVVAVEKSQANYPTTESVKFINPNSILPMKEESKKPIIKYNDRII